MEPFWKATAAVLVTVVLALTVGKREKDISALLAMAACCLVGLVAVSYLEPVVDLVRELSALGEIQNGILGALLKSVGIGLVAEIAGMLCTDAGNGSLGKMLQILGSAVILYLSIPIVQALLMLIREILGEL